MTQKLKNKAINQEITANVFFVKIGTKRCQDGFLNDFQLAKLLNMMEFCQKTPFLFLFQMPYKLFSHK